MNNKRPSTSHKWWCLEYEPQLRIIPLLVISKILCWASPLLYEEVFLSSLFRVLTRFCVKIYPLSKRSYHFIENQNETHVSRTGV